MDVRGAEVVLPCADLDAALPFFTEELGFRLEVVFPADDPRVAVISGHGVRVRLERDAAGPPGLLRLACHGLDGAAPRELVAPDGTRVHLVDADPPVSVPSLAPAFVVTRMTGPDDDGAWTRGRAGMRYRDLIPGRQGGRFVASHIHVSRGGPIPDQVHFHAIHFQVIHCCAGWVRVVYEDQGPPFVLRAGDTVLQPPGIRHRVLGSAPDTEVVEVTCPAVHETRFDHELVLPNETETEREFGGQRFARSEATAGRWGPWRLPGFEVRDTGIGAAADGIGGVRVVRRSRAAPPLVWSHDAELLFGYVTAGTLVMHHEGHAEQRLGAGDAFVLPAGALSALADVSEDLELLEVTLPAAFETRHHAGVPLP